MNNDTTTTLNSSSSSRESRKSKKCKPGFELYTVPSRKMAAKISNLPSQKIAAADDDDEKVEIFDDSTKSPPPAIINDDKVKNVNFAAKIGEKNGNFAEKTQKTSSKSLDLAPKKNNVKKPQLNHGFENLRLNNAKIPKFKPKNRQTTAPPPPPPATSKKMTLLLDDSGGSFGDLVLAKGFTVENSNLKMTNNVRKGNFPPPTATNFPPTATNFPPTATNFTPTATNFTPTATDFTPTATNFTPTVTNFPPTVTNFPPTATNFLPTATNFPPTTSNFPPTTSNFPPTVTNFPPTTSNFPPTATTNFPPPPKKYDISVAVDVAEKLKISESEPESESISNLNNEKSVILSPIFNAKSNISWSEIMENEAKGEISRAKNQEEEEAPKILRQPGIIKMTNEMAAVLNNDFTTTTKKCKGRGFQYSNEIVVTEAPPKSSSFHEKSAGRGKFLYRRDAAPPGSNDVRLSDVEYKRGKSDVGNKNVDGKRQECDVKNKNVDVEYKREQSDVGNKNVEYKREQFDVIKNVDGNAQRFSPENPPPPAKFSTTSTSTIQEKSFTIQNLDPIDQMYAAMKLLLDRGGNAIDIDHIMSMRLVIQQKYEKVVQMDYNANFKYGVERKMWKSAFYDVIEFLRIIISQDKSTESRRQVLRNLIDEGIKCYDNLLCRSLRAYNIYLRDFLTDFDDNLRPGTKIQKTVQDLQSAQKYVLYTCHKFKISLGDLERYKQQFKGENFKNAQENCDYSAARKHYLEATQMLPGYGRPYNQLALLAQYTNRTLDTVYYFFRSLSVKHPFLSATESMKCTFDIMKQKVDQHQKSLKIDDAARKELENRENIMAKSRRNEIWIDPDNCLEKPWPNTKIQNLNDIDVESDEIFEVNSFKDTPSQVLHKQFVIYFLALHGMIFGKIDLDKFEEFAVYNLKQMREILSRGQTTPFSAFSLVQIAFICLFNVEEAGGQANIQNLPKDQCPIRFQHAVKLTLSIFGLLIEKLHQLWISGDRSLKFLIQEEQEPLSNVLLPAIRVFCSYLSSFEAYQCYSNSGYLEPLEKPGFRINLWSNLADLGNFWCHYRDEMNRNGKESDLIVIILPEDDLCFPIKKIAKLFPVKVLNSLNEPLQILAQKSRLNSLVELLEFWDAQETNEIYLPIKIENGKFVVVDRESSTDRPPEAIFRRRSTASQNENDQHSSFLNNSENSHDISAETLAFRTNQKDEEAKNALREKEQKLGVVLRVEPVFLAPDTNTFIDHLNAVEKLISNSKIFKLRVPLIVVEELKGLTKDLDNKWKSEQSKESLEFLRRMEKDHSRKFPTVEYITVNGSSVPNQDYSHENDSENMTNDDRILTSCVKFSSTKNTNPKSVDISIEPIQLEKKLVLLTGDRNLRVKAISKQVPVRTISEFCSWVEFKPKKL